MHHPWVPRIGIAALAAVASMAACQSPFGFNAPDVQMPDVTIPDVSGGNDPGLPPGVDPYVCQSRWGIEVVVDGNLQAALDRFATLEEGVVDLPLSEYGCLRVEREVAGGVVQRLQVYRGAAGVGRWPLARWVRDEAGVTQGQVQANEEDDDASDGAFEVEETIDPAEGRLVRTVYDQVRDVQRRWTLSHIGGVLRSTEEAMVDGALAVTADYDVAPGNETDGVGACDEQPCSDADVARFESLMREVLSKGFRCMAPNDHERGAGRARAMVAMALAWRSAHAWSCVPADCSYTGRFDTDAMTRGEVHITMMPGRSDDYTRQTLFHELTHGFAGLHDPSVLPLIGDDKGQVALERLQATDPANACERFCFGSYPNACNCAACLDRRVCDPVCKDLPSCVVRDPLSNALELSEAVGASCSEGLLDTTYTWYGNMAECQAGCSGDCTSHSRSCDPGCN